MDVEAVGTYGGAGPAARTVFVAAAALATLPPAVGPTCGGSGGAALPRLCWASAGGEGPRAGVTGGACVRGSDAVGKVSSSVLAAAAAVPLDVTGSAEALASPL